MTRLNKTKLAVCFIWLSVGVVFSDELRPLKTSANRFPFFDIPKSTNNPNSINNEGFLPFDSKGALRLNFDLLFFDIADKRYPLNLQYSKDSRLSRLLPAGWYIPMLDSYVVMQDSNTVSAALPNGDTRNISLDSNGKLSSYSGDVSGQVSGRNVNFESRDGRFQFQDGLLTRWQTDGGDLEWVYIDGRVSEILSEGKSVLKVSVLKDGGEGGINLRSEGSKCLVKFSDIEELSSEYLRLRGIVGAGMVTAIEREGEKLNIDYENIRRGLNEMRFTSDDLEADISVDDDWYVKSVNSFSVKVDYPDSTTKIPSIKLVAENDEFLIQNAMAFSDAREVKFLSDGSKEIRYYTITVNGARVRKIEIESPNGSVRESYSAQYNESGKLLRYYEEGLEKRIVGEWIEVWKDGKFIYKY